MKKRIRFLSGCIKLVLVAGLLFGCAQGDNKGETENGYIIEEEKSIAGDSCSPSESAFQTEEYSAITENGFQSSTLQPLSTFSADVDMASYSNVRRMLEQGAAPSEIPKGAVRIEEMINYFRYDYPKPEAGLPFGITIDAAACPWNEENGLLRIGLKTADIDFRQAKDSNLVLLLDVSGSMNDADKLPLLKQAFSILAENLSEKDCVSIVTYAGTEQVVLEGTRGNQRGSILEALEHLQAEGSTNGSQGIETAYAIAEKFFIEGGNNRVVLATDGDLNVGITSESSLKDFIAEKRESQIYLSVLGFGTGNIKDNKMKTLADNGNGNYYYIDSQMEAKRVMAEELGSNFVTVADDVKLQIEFNPAYIAEYRLVGYEDRLLDAQDFTDDTKDAGEVGAGHRVTALYELVWAGVDNNTAPTLKYQQNIPNDTSATKEWATLKIRYKNPGTSQSQELVQAFGAECYQEELKAPGMRLAASVAEFGMLLRDSEYKGNCSYEQILDMWKGVSTKDNKEVLEFLELVRLAKGATGDKISSEQHDEMPPPVELRTLSGEVLTKNIATMGSYEWSYLDNWGQEQSVVACGAAPKDWQDITAIAKDMTDGTVELCFDESMVSYTVNYWEKDGTNKMHRQAGTFVMNEKASLVQASGNIIELPHDGDSGIYEINVTYQNGTASYGFMVE